MDYTPRLRLMMMGRPKMAKTGSIAALLNAGFEVGVLDFDGNRDPLLAFTKPEFLPNLSIVTVQDKLSLTKGLSQGKEYVQLADEPTAIRRGFQALDNWSKADPTHDWGPVRSWGTNRVLVLDSLTSMGDASFDRVRFINQRNQGNTRDSDWGVAMQDQSNMLAKLMSAEFKCHVLVLSHLKLIGPKVERMTKDDDDALVDVKVAISKANTDAIPTRYYPSALGRALPQEILRRVPAAVLYEVIDGKRVIVCKPRADVAADIGVPGPLAKDTLPIETGLIDIMYAVTGHNKPY